MSEAWWSCKIGPADLEALGPNADGPMRFAIAMMFKVLTGHEPEFLFSGWGDPPTESEREYIDSARSW